MPKHTGRPENDKRCRDHLQHQRERLAQWFDQNARGNIGYNDHRNDPAKNQTEEARINDVGITRDIEEVEITVNESLSAHDPETDRCQIQHDGIMNGDAETDRHQIEENMQWLRRHSETGKRNDNHRATERGIDYAIEPELFRRNGELAVDWQDQEWVESSSANQFGNVRDIDEKERLKKLSNDLVSADEEDHFPFRPVPDAVDWAEDDAEKHDLAEKPQHFHQHPKNEIGLETHLANERVAQHDAINFDITPQAFHLS